MAPKNGHISNSGSRISGKIRYQNRQRWSECQLVSIWNAMRYWGIDPKIPGIDTDEYRSICAKYHAINGAALRISGERRRLGLSRVQGKKTFAWLRSHLPAELGVFCHQGYHSTLAIGVRRNKVLLTNYARGRTFWISWRLLKTKLRDNPCQLVPTGAAISAAPTRP